MDELDEGTRKLLRRLETFRNKFGDEDLYEDFVKLLKSLPSLFPYDINSTIGNGIIAKLTEAKGATFRKTIEKYLMDIYKLPCFDSNYQKEEALNQNLPVDSLLLECEKGMNVKKVVADLADHYIIEITQFDFIDLAEGDYHDIFGIPANCSDTRMGRILEKVCLKKTMAPIIIFYNFEKLINTESCVKQEEKFLNFLTAEGRKTFEENYFLFPINIENMRVILLTDAADELPPSCWSIANTLKVLNNQIQFPDRVHKNGLPQSFQISKTPSRPLDRYFAELSSLPYVNKLKFKTLHGSQALDFNFDFKPTDFIELEPLVVKRYAAIKRYKFVLTEPNVEMAIKFVHVPLSTSYDEFKTERYAKLKREIENLTKLNGIPNIVTLYGVGLHDGQTWFCMELMDFSLADFYPRFNESSFPQEFLGYIAVSIVDALENCKTLNIFHRDVKPANILMKRSGEIKLADFGESKEIENSIATTQAIGTIIYMAPERLMQPEDVNNPDKFDIRSDIWSFGITLCEVICGRYPIRNQDGQIPGNGNFMSMSQHLMKMNYQQFVSKILGPYVGESEKELENLRNFLNSCVTGKESRSTCKELMELEFYTEWKPHTTMENFAKYTSLFQL